MATPASAHRPGVCAGYRPRRVPGIGAGPAALRGPDEVLADIQRRTVHARFGRDGEVLFDRICRDYGIVHRLTQPATPTTTGKVERFHQTLRRHLLNDHGPFADLDDLTRRGGTSASLRSVQS
jgi:transposase